MLEPLFTKLKAKAVGSQHWLNFTIRCAASCLLFSVYPHYLILVYLGNNGFFSYDLFHAGDSGIHAVLGYSFIFVLLLGFCCLLPVFAVLELKEQRKSRDQATGVERKKAVKEVRFAILLLIMVSLLLCLIVGIFYWTGSSRLLVLVAFVAVIYVGTGYAAFKIADTLRYVVVLCLGYGVLLILPLYTSALVSGLVGFGLDRFGLGGGIATVTVELSGRAPLPPIHGRLVLLSPEQIFLVESDTGRKVIIPRTTALVEYDAPVKDAPATRVPPSKSRENAVGDDDHSQCVKCPHRVGRCWDDKKDSWWWSPKDYFYTAIGALLGAGAGLGFAALVERAKGRRNRERLLKAIVMSLEFNRDRAQQAKETLEKGWPSFPLDGARLAGLIAEAHGVLSEHLVRDLDWHRFQLDHITFKLEVAATSYVTKAASGDEATQGYQKSLRTSMIEHCEIVIAGTGKLVAAVNDERQ